MADTQTTVYNLTKPEVGASEDTWGEKLNTNLDALDDLLSGSTTLQGAKLDDTTRIVDNADATKIVALSAGNLTTATTRTFTFPDATGTFVLNDNTATLTNKTLTSPAILTGFTFDGTTVTALSGADTTVVTGTAGTSGNVAAWNADGDVVDGGYAPGGMVFIESQDASTSATLDFTGFDATKYDSYVFKLLNLKPSTGTYFAVTTSANGGSSYDAGASDYAYTYYGFSSTSGTVINGSDSDFTAIRLGNDVIASGDGLSGTVEVFGPHLAKDTNITHSVTYHNGGGGYSSNSGGGMRLSSAIVDAIRFATGSGTIISGTITMYGLINS